MESNEHTKLLRFTIVSYKAKKKQAVRHERVRHLHVHSIIALKFVDALLISHHESYRLVIKDSGMF